MNVKNLNIFLLVGQSNMAGRGRLADVSVLKHHDVFMFRNDTWIQAEEPLHTDKPEMAGIGLGMSFAIEMINRCNITPVGLVPCAVGGSRLNSWMPGANLFENAVITTKKALKNGKIAGVLWHQGEGDSGTPEKATSYGDRFREMARGLRAEFPASILPVISGELGYFLKHNAECQFYELVNKQLRELEGIMPAYACATAENLQDKGDRLHFSADSLRKLGIRYTKRFKEVIEISKSSEPNI